jgi:hypothetical protein
MITPTADQLTATLKYLGFNDGTAYDVTEQIELIYEYPPIPDRNSDWRAQFKGREEGLCGFGLTRERAIQDLLETVEAWGT